MADRASSKRKFEVSNAPSNKRKKTRFIFRIPCHSKLYPLKSRLHGYAAMRLNGYAATWPRGYAATRLRGYLSTVEKICGKRY